MNLSTTYLGFSLPHPLVPGACPLTGDVDTVKRLEDAGAPMIVMHSVFQEQIDRESVALNYGMEQAANSSAEAATYLPEPDEFRLGPDEYLATLQKIKKAVKVPVVASLNGRTKGGWIDYAKKLQQAGADAIELNIYDPVFDLHADSGSVEAGTLEVIRAVRAAVKVPLAVKLSPFYTGLVAFANRASMEGVKGLVLFNRFYQPDLDLENLEVTSELKLSTSDELLPRLRWTAALWGRVTADLAITGGVHTALDALKAVCVGASCVQMVSSLLIHGPKHLQVVRQGMERWLEEHEYESLKQACGSMSLLKTANAAAYERGNYVKILQSWSPA